MIKEMMKRYGILWVIVLGLVGGFLWFGTSDFRHPELRSEYAGRNPGRPIFRIFFGGFMSMLTIGTGVWITKVWSNQLPE